MGLFKTTQQHKFCPVCGTQLKITDGYCIKCGYSFQARHKKKGISFRNVVIFLILLAIIYFGLRYANGFSIIPTSMQDALNFKLK
ncbi:MAG: DUF2116 family Zn-ribbon domain-containing protein [Nanoarchaeota archaeon]